MKSLFKIKTLVRDDISRVTNWARKEGFAPGAGDVAIYRHTDRQGLWVGWLGNNPVGCIAGVRYNSAYGFIGMFLVAPEYRGKGYGLALWKHALKYLDDLPCIGLEAAPNRLKDYAGWNFQASSMTTRWQFLGNGSLPLEIASLPQAGKELLLLEGGSIPSEAVQAYDALREPSPRPHFLSDWLKHPAGKVLALVDQFGKCHGFGRIRPCLLQEGEGWRIGPLLADSVDLAELLLRRLIDYHPGVILLDSPGSNHFGPALFQKLGFKEISKTIRMYKGDQPPISMSEIYCLACLELG